MVWNAAIEKNREALKRVLAMLVGMAGLAIIQSPPLWGPAGQRGAPGETVHHPPLSAELVLGLAEGQTRGPTSPPQGGRLVLTLPRHLRLAVLRLLRPAEAAARRLIVIAARGIVVTLPPLRPRRPDPAASHAALRRLGIAIVAPNGASAGGATATRSGSAAVRVPSLPLADRLPRLPSRVERSKGRHVPAHRAPRILSLFGDTPPHRLPPPPGPDDPVDATRLNLRLQALASALDDLPGQALRLARWTARRRLASQQGRVGRTLPLKPGRAAALPKSFGRRRPAHEVHDILRDLHGLARWALEKPDTS